MQRRHVPRHPELFRVFFLTGGRKEFLGETRAVSEREAKKNVWWKTIVPEYGTFEEGQEILRHRMCAERVNVQPLPAHAASHRVQPSLFSH